MADETPATESTAEQPNDLSKPVGINDSATFDKYFGKDSKLWDGDKPKEKSSSSTGSKQSGGKDSKSESAKPSTDTKAPRDTSKDSKGKDSKVDSKDTKSESKHPPKDKAEPPKETQTETDDEGTSSKAKDLFAKAKAATDTREGRKLYRQAMKEAFGEVPDEFNDQKWAAARQKREADSNVIKKQAANLEANVAAAQKKLTPAINVMTRLVNAGMTRKLADGSFEPIDGALVDQSIRVMRGLRQLRDGDFTILGQLVADASGVDQEEAMKRFVRGVKASPEGRAARAAAEAAERRAAETERKLAELQRQLEAEKTAKATQQTKAEQDAEQAAARANYLESIELELEGHPVLKLPRGKERVFNYLLKTANKVTRAPRYSKERVADLIVASERKRLAAARDVLEPGEEPAPVQRLRTPSRSDTAEPGHVPESPEASFERIWARRQAGGRR